MNAKQFQEVYGRERAKEVAAGAGISYPYFYQIVTGRRRPSVELAQKLVKASGGEMGFTALLTAEKRKAHA